MLPVERQPHMEKIRCMLMVSWIPIILFVVRCRSWRSASRSRARSRGAWSASRSSRRCRPSVTARLERMEQAIDSIAVEVERISEGQRFTTKLLSERSAPTPERSADAQT